MQALKICSKNKLKFRLKLMQIVEHLVLLTTCLSKAWQKKQTKHWSVSNVLQKFWLDFKNN